MANSASSPPAKPTRSNDASIRTRKTGRLTEPRGVDFSKGVTGKYYDRAIAASNVVIIAPDLLDTFPDSNSVNAALRSLKEIASRTKKRASRVPRSRAA